MRLKPTLSTALIALGGAGVANTAGHSRDGAISSLSNDVSTGGVSVVKADSGGYEIRLSKVLTLMTRLTPESALTRAVKPLV